MKLSAFILTCSAYVLLWWGASWPVAVGVFLAIWASNMENVARGRMNP